MSWLEHAARSAAGALRPVDAYYEPYDLLEAKAECGRMVLDARMERGLDEDEDEGSAERVAPWIVWEEAEKGGGFGGGDPLAMMMAMRGMFK